MPFGGKKEAIVFSREKTRIIFNLGIFSEYERTKVWSFVFLQARVIAFNHFLLFSKKTRVRLMVNMGFVKGGARMAPMDGIRAMKRWALLTQFYCTKKLSMVVNECVPGPVWLARHT